jgi:hypothetical protein
MTKPGAPALNPLLPVQQPPLPPPPKAHLLQVGELRGQALLLGRRGVVLRAQGRMHLAQVTGGDHDVFLPDGGVG